MERLRDYCSSTSLHGWQYCFRKNASLAHTVGWVLVLSASVGAVAYLMTINIRDFANATVAFTLESPTVPLSEVYFPAITICNMNKLRKSFIYSLLEDPLLSNVSYNELHATIEKAFITGDENGLDAQENQLIKKIFASDVYKGLFEELRSSAFSNRSSIEANVHIHRWHYLSLTDITQANIDKVRASSFLELASQFRDVEVIPSLSFVGFGLVHIPGFNTDLSDTCHNIVIFVKEPADIMSFQTMSKQVTNGANNGFQLLLDSESYDYGSSVSGGEGFAVSLAHHLDCPVMKQTGLRVQPGQSVELGVTPSLLATTPTARRRFEPKDRQCYFDDEFKLEHFPANLSFRYSMSNCLFEAILQRVQVECGCLPSNFLGIVQDGLEACQGRARKTCANKLIDSIGSEKHARDAGSNSQKECLAACDDQFNAILVTQASFPNLASFHRHPYFCLIAHKIYGGCHGDRRRSLVAYNPSRCRHMDVVNVSDSGHDCHDLRVFTDNATVTQLQRDIAVYTRDNVVSLNVYIREPYVKRFVNEEKITEINFVGTVGGVMGLFTGFSFISVLEILYFLFCVKSAKSTEEETKLEQWANQPSKNLVHPFPNGKSK